MFFPPSRGSWSYVCSEPTNPFATATLPTHLLQPCSLLRAGFVKFWLPTPRWPSRVGRRRQVAGPGPQIRGAECQDAPQQASAPVREFPKMYPTEYFAFSHHHCLPLLLRSGRHLLPDRLSLLFIRLLAIFFLRHVPKCAAKELLPCSSLRAGYDAAANLCSRAGARPDQRAATLSRPVGSNTQAWILDTGLHHACTGQDMLLPLVQCSATYLLKELFSTTRCVADVERWKPWAITQLKVDCFSSRANAYPENWLARIRVYRQTPLRR